MKCNHCLRTIRGPKLVVSGNWWCSECVYWRDQGKTPPYMERDKG